MKTVIEQLITVLNDHLTYDDDLTPKGRDVLTRTIDKLRDKLTAEKVQLHEAFEDGYAQGYNQGKVDGWKKSLNTDQ